MSLRWSSCVAPKPPPPKKKGGGESKTQNDRFQCKIALHLKKVCYKVSLCENWQRESCKAFIGLSIRAKMIGGGDPCFLKFWVKLTALEQNRRFSIVAPQRKKVQLTIIESPLRAFQWAQDEHRTLSLSPPKGGSKTQSVQNLNNKNNN